MTPTEKIQAIEKTHLPDALHLLARYYRTLAELHAKEQGRPVNEPEVEYTTSKFLPVIGKMLIDIARYGVGQDHPHKILQDFNDLDQHGDYTAAALALGDVWIKLPTTTRRDVSHLARQLAPACDIWPAFDDLDQHGDYTGAALAFGDVWLTLPTDARAQVVQAVKQAVTNGR